MIRILIGGDVCPMGKIENAFEDGNANEIFHDLLEDIGSVDLSIVNLECPLVSKETPITKVGEVLGVSDRCVQGFVTAKWNVLNLANNHIFDHGVRGLLETIDTIEGAGLNYIGAGKNIKDAQTPILKEINGERIVIYSMAEREFSIADQETPGANPLDLINFINAIRLHKQQGIFIVLIHGGNEYYPYPSPEMVRRCRFMIEMGADAIICCHTHCPLPWEIYAHRPIVYGLGNLIFEAIGEEPDSWYEGYLAKLTFEDKQVHLEVVPYFQSQARHGAEKMDENARSLFFNKMHRKNQEVNDRVFIEDRWLEYCRQQRAAYLAGLFGYNRLMRKMANQLMKRLHSKKDVLRALHLVQCEAHQEVLNTIFRDEKGG